MLACRARSLVRRSRKIAADFPWFPTPSISFQACSTGNVVQIALTLGEGETPPDCGQHDQGRLEEHRNLGVIDAELSCRYRRPPTRNFLDHSPSLEDRGRFGSRKPYRTTVATRVRNFPEPDLLS